MLSITLITIILAIPLFSNNTVLSLGVEQTIKTNILYTRIGAIALIYAAIISYNGSFSLDGVSLLYSGLIYTSTTVITIEVYLLSFGAIILLLSYYSYNISLSYKPISEYTIMIIFTVLGALFLISSIDLISIYLAIELQSFGVYIITAIYRDSGPATAAGLKYFILGALSSALILLGSAVIYGSTGTTNITYIYELVSVPDAYAYINLKILLGIVLVSIGLFFKIAAAPFHYWAPDVYDGAPTVVTTWLTVIPKISILIFILNVYLSLSFYNTIYITMLSYLLAFSAIISLIIGTVVGLGQYRVKRLLAYSTISHVGFILLALATSILYCGEASVEAFFFYIVQYSITNINLFSVLLSFAKKYKDISFTSELVGGFWGNPYLTFSFAISLFSIAGVPPLLGFFAKYIVLSSAIQNGYYLISIIAILASVVSAVYYLRIIRTLYFEKSSYKNIVTLSSTHCYIIAVITLFILLFAVAPTLIFNTMSIMALSIYIT